MGYAPLPLPPSSAPAEAPPRWSDGERTPMFPNPIPQATPDFEHSRAWPAIRGALLTLGAFIVLILAGVGLITMVQRAAILLCR